MGERDAIDELSADEREALSETERALEWFHRAHGALIEFHHAVGRGMDHFDGAEERLGGEHDDVADRIRGDVLPAGVTDDGKLTYELVAEFEDGLLAEVESVADATFEELADGRRYLLERETHDEGSSD